MHRLSHFLEKVTASVQDANDIVGILAGSLLRVGQFLEARPSSPLSMTVIFHVQSLPSYISVSCSVFCLLDFDLLDVDGGAGRGKKRTASEILVRLFPRLLSNDIERRVGISMKV